MVIVGSSVEYPSNSRYNRLASATFQALILVRWFFALTSKGRSGSPSQSAARISRKAPVVSSSGSAPLSVSASPSNSLIWSYRRTKSAISPKIHPSQSGNEGKPKAIATAIEKPDVGGRRYQSEFLDKVAFSGLCLTSERLCHVQVAVRVRPFNAREKKRNAGLGITMDPATGLVHAKGTVPGGG
ncbi:hypothetical protein AAMO2058_000701600 [Amorphochlora amoebiformis]